MIDLRPAGKRIRVGDAVVRSQKEIIKFIRETYDDAKFHSDGELWEWYKFRDEEAENMKRVGRSKCAELQKRQREG